MSDTWQPIETAPKDAFKPLMLGHDVLKIVAPGYWTEAVHDAPDEMGHDAGFVDASYSAFFPGRSFGNPEYQSRGAQPTHWMPLPEPPQ